MRELLPAIYALLHGPQGPLYTQQMYPRIGVELLASTLITVAFYYYILGWHYAKFNMVRHWLAMLLFNAAVSMTAVAATGYVVFGAFGSAGLSLLKLALIQGLYASALFVIVSFGIKWRSPNARRTPV